MSASKALLHERSAICLLWHSWYVEYHKAHPNISADEYCRSLAFKQRRDKRRLQYAAEKTYLARKMVEPPRQKEPEQPEQPVQTALAQTSRSRYDYLTRPARNAGQFVHERLTLANFLVAIVLIVILVTACFLIESSVCTITHRLLAHPGSLGSMLALPGPMSNMLALPAPLKNMLALRAPLRNPLALPAPLRVMLALPAPDPIPMLALPS